MMEIFYRFVFPLSERASEWVCSFARFIQRQRRRRSCLVADSRCKLVYCVNDGNKYINAFFLLEKCPWHKHSSDFLLLLLLAHLHLYTMYNVYMRSTRKKWSILKKKEEKEEEEKLFSFSAQKSLSHVDVLVVVFPPVSRWGRERERETAHNIFKK